MALTRFPPHFFPTEKSSVLALRDILEMRPVELQITHLTRQFENMVELLKIDLNKQVQEDKEVGDVVENYKKLVLNVYLPSVAGDCDRKLQGMRRSKIRELYCKRNQATKVVTAFASSHTTSGSLPSSSISVNL